MGSLWDDIRKSLKQGLETVADYTDQYTKIGRLKVDETAIKHSINRLFAELGGRVYELLAQDARSQVAADEKVSSLVGRIRELEGKLRQKQAETEKIKQEKEEQRKKKASSRAPSPTPQAEPKPEPAKVAAKKRPRAARTKKTEGGEDSGL
ncbi:MAG: hypothetical protein QHJ34_02100 [bacterium]|jgi:TolA-binding protein|nr:hypothetical protein [candidate division KSB1 bacterium]MDH7559010.1 hypothetical protein [bacterium]